MAKRIDWRFLSIERPTVRQGEPSNIVLQIASPAGTVRSIPLSPADMVKMIEGAALQLRLFMDELAGEGRGEG